jgi:hypothetical protein
MIETEMTRPFWTDKPQFEDITVLICQNKTHDLIRLCLESLFTFYPTIKTLVVNGSPNDQSGNWLKYKEAKLDNLTVWDRVGYDSHGVAMHEAIMYHVRTKYVLLLDSDVIVKRGGIVELMYRYGHNPHITQIKPSQEKPIRVLAAGMLMKVTRKGHACGPPKNEKDTLRYIHPSTGLYNVEMYKEMKANFVDHGAPCYAVMMEAEKKGLKVVGVPVADYVMHLSGASWTSPRTVWEWDNNVHLRPLVTFVAHSDIRQQDNDYDIVRPKKMKGGRFVIHGRDPQPVSNDLFTMRFNVTGDYVCLSDNPPPHLVTLIRKHAIMSPKADILDIEGHHIYSRKYFQSIASWV